MQGIGIYDQDILVVDRSQTPTLNSIVIVVLDGELPTRRWVPQPHPPIEVTAEMSCEVWGVVTEAGGVAYEPRGCAATRFVRCRAAAVRNQLLVVPSAHQETTRTEEKLVSSSANGVGL